ncbi:MAG: hypothetical protein EBV83_06675 [Verrucomicrobia bacterium]|jgi:hypothetical protein|nr:hypothetical protein [Verrucomicrobiota bacterium]
MLKRPKHKKGFTLGHYFDEWWDRVGQEFKAKLFISVWFLFVSSSGLGLYVWYKQQERRDLLEVVRSRQARESGLVGDKVNQRPTQPGSWSPRED